MDEHLQRLARELRAEKCPRRVLDNVAARIARESRPFGRVRFGWAAAGVCLAAFMAAWTVWYWASQDSGNLAPSVARGEAGHSQVAAEAGAALGYIGAVLIEAGKHTENVLLNQAVPPLRSGVESVKQNLINKL